MDNAKQSIRFLTAPDGVRIAYAVSGSGPPLVKCANWLNHLEYDWNSPVWRHLLKFLSEHFTLIRYDERGCGLSDWHCDDLSFESWVNDLELVVAANGLKKFPVLGISQGGAVAVEYACRHPDKISHMILFGAYAVGRDLRQDQTGVERARALYPLVPVGWNTDNPAFRQVFGTLFMPEADEEQMRWFTDLCKNTTDAETALRILDTSGHINVVDRLKEVQVPTLVIHARGDEMVSFEQGRLLATEIPDARFVPLEGRNHILLQHEKGWIRFQEEVLNFIGPASPLSQLEMSASGLAGLTRRELQVLEQVALGLSNADIAARLFLSEKTVRNHLTSIFSKLRFESRAQAIVFAREHGMPGRSQS